MQGVAASAAVSCTWAPNAPTTAKEVLATFAGGMEQARLAVQRLHLTLWGARVIRLGWQHPAPRAWISVGPVRGAAAARRFFLLSMQAQEHLLRCEHDAEAEQFRLAVSSEAEAARLMQYFAGLHFEGQVRRSWHGCACTYVFVCMCLCAVVWGNELATVLRALS